MTQSLTKKYPGRSVRRDGNKIVVTIPVKFYRRNGRQMVASQPSGNDFVRETRSNVNTELATTIAKAWEWQEELESGKFGSIEELAQGKNVGRTYAGRLLRLTSLSPTIVESILKGGDSEISLRLLHKGIPHCWNQHDVANSLNTGAQDVARVDCRNDLA